MAIQTNSSMGAFVPGKAAEQRTGCITVMQPHGNALAEALQKTAREFNHSQVANGSKLNGLIRMAGTDYFKPQGGYTAHREALVHFVPHLDKFEAHVHSDASHVDSIAPTMGIQFALKPEHATPENRKAFAFMGGHLQKQVEAVISTVLNKQGIRTTQHVPEPLTRLDAYQAS
jgi:hypothetical protein